MMNEFWQILTYAGAGVGGLLVKLAWDKIKGIEKESADLRGRTAEIEKNYITRFEDMQLHITQTKEEIIGKITELRVCLAESYVKKSDLTSRRTTKQK